ncbi:hypothetical protein [Streptomyces sp. H27-D2]|nr:hypothetical protein [Streptomyces sp. H27-D2]MEC4016485.1 hypothetical protein [Streptomyces sp. H27-D2]
MTERMDTSDEKTFSRHLWWRVGYFLFAIHIVAFVMIIAVTHAPR